MCNDLVHYAHRCSRKFWCGTLVFQVVVGSSRDPLRVLGNTVYNAVSHVPPTGERVLSTVILSLPGNSRGVCRGAAGIGNCMKQVKGLFDGRV